VSISSRTGDDENGQPEYGTPHDAKCRVTETGRGKLSGEFVVLKLDPAETIVPGDRISYNGIDMTVNSVRGVVSVNTLHWNVIDASEKS